MNVTRTCLRCQRTQASASALSRRKLCPACESLVPAPVKWLGDSVIPDERLRYEGIETGPLVSIEGQLLVELTRMIEYAPDSREACLLRGRIAELWATYDGRDFSVLFEPSPEEVAAKTALRTAAEERRALADYRRREKVKEMQESKRIDAIIARGPNAPRTSSIDPEIMARLTSAEQEEYRKSLGD